MSSIAHLFVAGGFVMYPLVIFLLFALMIGIERIMLYRKFTKDLRRFNKVLEKNQSWVMLPSVPGTRHRGAWFFICSRLCAVQRTIMV